MADHTDLSMIYTTARDDGGAILRCTHCPDWECDVDGDELPKVLRDASDHIGSDAHRSRTR